MKKIEIYKIGNDIGVNNNKIDKILLKVTGLSKSQLFLCDEIDEKYVEELKNCFIRYTKGEPIEFIINNAEFYGLDFYVDNRVLIPRNDTEIMVDKAIETIKNCDDKITLIDVGTGSSNIVISVMKNVTDINNELNCYAIELSKEALEVSKINIEKHLLTEKINIFCGDLLEPIIENKFELNKNLVVTANLPYIKDGDYQNMDIETVFYEPDIALYGGKLTGFELYERIIVQVLELKKLYDLSKIVLFIEIGFDQKEISKDYLNNKGLKFEVFNDNYGIERCVRIEM
ncbi:MAG: peptide chain release factor N(5)-glutamine methyltransferase [Candidatus Gracilibacteria bacterium]|nr:peptide chain release factor N(5)-glutamine methyltransferase [Candidatus Gracilibacteria bacterium]